MAAHGITLTRTDQANFVSARTQGYRIQVVASNPLNMTAKIFCYRVGAVDPDTGERMSKFTNISSPSDIAQYPPEFTQGENWYRSDSIDLVFRRPDQADAAWDLILSDIVELVEVLDMLDEFGTETVVRVGADESSSSSESSS